MRRILHNASAGEKRMFKILQALPDDCIVYYEPIVGDQYPDFILIDPDHGLMVIEVKGWYPKYIKSGDSHSVKIDSGQGREENQKHPVRQAREYMYNLMDVCRRSNELSVILNEGGEHENKFIFPFGYFAVLNNITKQQLVEHELGDLTSVFTEDRVVTRDQLLEWENLEEGVIRDIIKGFFKPRWNFPKLNENQIDVIRAVIHPEIRITPVGQDITERISLQTHSIKVLDLKQENNARNIGSGHRVVNGVAGSGKTILLLARAKILASKNPALRILIVCFNVVLAAFLRRSCQEFPGIEVYHFDGLVKKFGIVRNHEISETDEELGDRFLQFLETNDSYVENKYHTVLIDEAQDFPAVWFRCIMQLMEDPDDGDLLIVADGNQGLYRKTKFTWSSLGIQARGRSVSTKFDLDKNYRNSREIMSLASAFAEDGNDSDEDTIQPMAPREYLRESGIAPRLTIFERRQEESDFIVQTVSELLKGNWGDVKFEETITSEDIMILYPYKPKSLKDDFDYFLKKMQAVSKTMWISDPSNKKNRSNYEPDSIRIQTIHSAKGLQAKAVILMWADLLPREFKDSDESEDIRLLYVALTRAETVLQITATGHSKFTQRQEAAIQSWY